METLYLLIPLSLVLAVVIAVAFWWSVDSGQFENLESEGELIVRDDDNAVEKPAQVQRKHSI
jgi:cbb3-type cytochrome oxidase maturation protein